MPTIKRIGYIGLSVRDARRSAAWWQELLGMEVELENFDSANWPAPWNEVLLVDRETGLKIGLMEHPSNPGDPFDEFRTGLDHVEFEVSSREELDEWLERLDALRIPHSGIKDEHIIVVRDPDNIQFEFFLARS